VGKEAMKNRKYKLGKFIFDDTFPSIDHTGETSYRTNGQMISTSILYESELLEMGAQLIEEEKVQVIEKLSEHGAYFPSLKQMLDKQNEIIEALNTHLSACGKEKQ
jgi:hypothetical protein